MTTATRPRPRERLIAAAADLTYRFGVGVGVDAILKEAQVARRSLYQHFGGKDGLVAEVIRSSAIDDERLYATTLDTGGDDPRARLLALFDGLDVLTSREGFRGCRYIAAHLNLASPQHPAHAEVMAHKQRVHGLLYRELLAMGHPDAEQAADRLQLLIDGILVEGALRPDIHSARLARPLVEAVLNG